VHNLLDAWISQGDIKLGGEGWSLPGGVEALTRTLPDTLQQMLEKQFASLSADEQKALESASVVGREFSAAAVASALGISEEEVEAICEPLARDGRFLTSGGAEEWPDGTFAQRYAFSHDLYVDVLYERIPAATRAGIHDALSRRFAAAWSGREREHATELAFHFAAGRTPWRAVEFYRLAAEQALARSAYHEAVDHLKAALKCLRGTPDRQEKLRAELVLRAMLAPSLVPIRGYADREVEENYLRARALALEADDSAAWSSSTYGLATMYEFRGNFAESEVLMKERLDAEPGPRARLESHQLLACSYIHQGRHQDCVEQARMAMEVLDLTPRENVDIVLAVESHGWAAGALLFSGKPDAAVKRARQALDLAWTITDEFGRASALVQTAFVHFYRREWDHVRPLAERAIAIGREHRFPFHVGVGRILLGWCLATEGNEEFSIGEIRGGLRTCRSVGAKLDDPTFLAVLAEALLQFTRTAEADETLQEALEIMRGTRSFFYEPEIHRLRGTVCRRRRDDPCRAAEHFRLAIDSALQQQGPFLALRAAVDLSRQPGSDGEEGRRIAAEVASRFEDGFDTPDYLAARAVLDS
jgi:tetratricopeptide (TPR) repeat protein